MIKILIVEDESYIRKGLITMIKSVNYDINIIGECESVSSAVAVANSCEIDLVLLDINLIGGTAFDFLEQVDEIKFKVIFISAYEEFALKALKNGAIDYILKPVDITELKDAFSKFNRYDLFHKDQLLVAKESFETKTSDRLVLRLQEGLQVIILKDLVYCKSDKGYTSFYLANGKKYIASKSIKEYASQLPTDIFVRIHQSYIVNMKFIDKYDKSGYIYLNIGVKVPVSSRKKESFISKLLGK